MEFKDLVFETDEMGESAAHLFDNHYGVSVVRGPYTYGGREGLYELAVIHMAPGDKYSKLCYDTPITGDVMGHLKPDDITEIMKQVEELPLRYDNEDA
jgi:hypothetical protein